MKLEFTYTTERELKRVYDTYNRRDFFIKYGYKVGLPNGVNFDNFTEHDEQSLLGLIEEEIDNKKAEKIKKTIEDGFNTNKDAINKYLQDLPNTVPEKFIVSFTQYGTGGSYGLPNMMIINITYNKKPFSTFVHEATHCMIEEPIVQKFKLSQPEKESVVNWLMLENPEIKKIFPDDKYQKFGKPSKELLKKVGLV